MSLIVRVNFGIFLLLADKWRTEQYPQEDEASSLLNHHTRTTKKRSFRTKNKISSEVTCKKSSLVYDEM